MVNKERVRWMAGVCAAVTFAVAAGQPRSQVYTFEVELDAGGALVAATPLRDPGDATVQQLQKELRNWVFRTAQQDGRAVPTSTWVRVTALAAQGEAPVKVLSATAGPAPERLRKPAFPVAAQLDGRQGVVVLQLDMDAQGRIRAVEVHDTVGQVSRAMAESAMASARGWTFHPERVNGVPLAGRLLMPVCFVASADSKACAWTGPESQAFGRDSVVALDPAVKLALPLAVATR